MRKIKCNNCTFYDAYYIKFSSNFTRINHGYCRKNTRPVVFSEMCDEYKSNEQKEKSREKRMLDTLERACVAIDEISQILKASEWD